MNKILSNKDANLNIILKKKIGIIGYGNQGRAQTLNLKDRGIDVKVGLRTGSSSKTKAKKDKVVVININKIVDWADIVCLLVPDDCMKEVYIKYVKKYISNKTLLFSHGYAVHYKMIELPQNIDVIMVAPSGGGALVRSEFINGRGVPNLLAVYQNFTGEAYNIVKSYSRAIGGTRVCSFFSTFTEETETDLFGEQAILTGGIPWLINKSFKVLLEEGYDPVVAWFVCYYELKTIVDLFHNSGFKYLYDSISPTAKFGGISMGKYLMDKSMDKKLTQMIHNIKTGKFHQELQSKKISNINSSDFEEIESYTKKILKIIKNNS